MHLITSVGILDITPFVYVKLCILNRFKCASIIPIINCAVCKKCVITLYLQTASSGKTELLL